MPDVRLRIEDPAPPPGTVGAIVSVVRAFPGEDPVFLRYVASDGEKKTLLLAETVDYCPEFFLAVRELGGVSLDIR